MRSREKGARRTVNGVDDKGWLGADSHAGLVCLLAHEGDGGKGGGQAGRDHLLHALVNFCDNVDGFISVSKGSCLPFQDLLQLSLVPVSMSWGLAPSIMPPAS